MRFQQINKLIFFFFFFFPSLHELTLGLWDVVLKVIRLKKKNGETPKKQTLCYIRTVHLYLPFQWGRGGFLDCIGVNLQQYLDTCKVV